MDFEEKRIALAESLGLVWCDDLDLWVLTIDDVEYFLTHGAVLYMPDLKQHVGLMGLVIGE